MERIERAGIDFCAIDAPEAFCLYSKKQQFLNMFIKNSIEHNITIEYNNNTNIYPKDPWETSFNVIRIMWTVLPVVPVLAITRIITAALASQIRLSYVFTYLLEFDLIVLPILFIVSVYNDIMGYLLPVLILAGCLQYIFIIKKPQNWYYQWGGRRPYVLTLNRTTINLLTSYCILAVDFPSFPKYFVKTHQFGASLMDVGIGLFVYSMGTVSEPPRKLSHFMKLGFNVLILLGLGMTRTLIIEFTSYSQDVHEYGTHWNAFFTLGITKAGAMVVSAFAKNSYGLFAAGVVFAVFHELNLQHNTSNFVMNENISRNTLFTSNREGICSLLGFISIYLFSMFMGHHLRMQSKLITKKVYLNKLKMACASALVLWLSVFACIFLSISIARVTCNLGYILFILAIAQTMTVYFMMGFHPILSKPDESNAKQHQTYLPLIVEAVNNNGLVFFLVSNLLTGAVKVCVEEENYRLEASVLILNAYMFVAITAVQILHYYNKRIG